MSQLKLPEGANMVLVQYTGTNVGSSNWGGPGTLPSGRYYRFGNNNKDRTKYVEVNDLDWFMNLRENGVNAFKLHEEVPSPVLQMAPPIIEENEPLVMIEPVDEIPGEEAISLVEPEEPLTDPMNLTLRQIEELDLTVEQWKWMGTRELAGKKRSTVLEFIKKKVTGA